MTPDRPPRPERMVIGGRYRVRRRLGGGSAGTVYLAESLGSGATVALKVIRPDAFRAEGIERLQGEFRALADLRHPQIATAYDFGYTEEGGLPFYTREYVEGVPLRPGPAGPGGQAEPRGFLRPIFDLLDALEYLHAHDILHLDVHAGNLIEAEDPSRGGVLIDFGIPRPGHSPSTAMTSSSGALLPPELIAGELPGPTADIHAAGRLLLYRLTGDYRGPARLPREIPGWGARLTLELERIVAKAVHDDPTHRFESAAKFRAALHAAVGGRESPRASVEPKERTVGRDPEIAEIEDGLRKASGGEGWVLWLHGPLGCGKSRLLTEARWRAQIQALSAVDLHFLPGGGSPSAEKQIWRALRGRPRAEGSWLAPLSTARGGTSAERARRAAAAFFSEAGPPALMLVDDLEHADPGSRLLIEALVSQCLSHAEEPGKRGLAIVVTSSQPPPRGLFPGEQRSRIRSLSPLPKSTAVKLLETLIRPLDALPATLSALASRTAGSPLRIRQLARFLHTEFGPRGQVPRDLARIAWTPEGTDLARRAARSRPEARRVLQGLAALGRPCRREEIAAATELSGTDIKVALRALTRVELVASTTQGRARLYYLSDASVGVRMLGELSRAEIRALHERAARFLDQAPRPDALQKASIARHRVAAGDQHGGRTLALEVVPDLVAQGHLGPAVSLLEAVSTGERSLRWRRSLAEEISEIHSLAGDHLEGASILEPVLRGELGALDPREAVRIRRRLGVHYHRAGELPRALPILEEARRLANPARDQRELVFLLSELAEYHTFRGDYERAESLCREGLEILGRVPDSSARFRDSMEVTLRASLGHLELRRMRLRPAFRELRAALKLSRRAARPVERAMILNNLGIVHNELNQYQAAAGCLRQSEGLLARAGEQPAIIQTACNLAMISAKLGEPKRALRDIDRARRLLKEHPGERLDFVVGISSGFTLHLLGDVQGAIDELSRSLPLGRRLGDDYLVRFGEVYLAEAHGISGHYEEARRLLRSVLSGSTRSGNSVLRRMASARLLLLERALGRERPAEEAEAIVAGCDRSGIDLLEAWNDLVLGTASLWTAGRAAELESALEAFERFSIPAGARLARLALLRAAVLRREPRRVRSLLVALERRERGDHGLLRVLEPLAAGEAALLLGETDRASQYQREASAAMVGRPFLELDVRIEILSARVADRRGDRDLARHHLDRAFQARDLIVRRLPARWRDAFLAHPRFREMDELQRRLSRSTAAASTPFRRGDTHYADLVGASAPMRELYELLDRLRDADLPALICGETGVGKEVVARTVHATSPRRDGPFYSLHCASLPPELFESELFGYEAGAFTGAEEAHPGLLEHVRGGTLLLDEITMLSPQTQSKLLGVVDTKSARPVGGVEPRAVDVRFLASTSADPEEAVASGSLRADLYYRFRAVEIRVPPLRSRRDDVPLLLRHFLTLHGSRLSRAPPAVSREALDSLAEHDWPGNVRELETLAVRLVVESSPGRVVGPADARRLLAPPKLGSLFPDAVLEGRDLDELRAELERAYLARLFRETGGRIPDMLAALGIRRSNLYTWFRRVGLDVHELRKGVDS